MLCVVACVTEREREGVRGGNVAMNAREVCRGIVIHYTHIYTGGHTRTLSGHLSDWVDHRHAFDN